MAKLLIKTVTGEVIETEGKMTFESVKREDEDGVHFETIGQLAIHEYISDIDEIESARYLLEGVDVYREIFGSDDFNILYEFKLEDGLDVTVKSECLTKEKIDQFKYEEYKDEDSKKWESDYGWMLETK